MALSSTLFTGLSGLVVNQTQLNVVGNNIANANTTAFKASRVLFSPQFYATQSSGSPISATSGGSNPTQVGLGAQVAAIDQDFSQGQLQSTGVGSDLAINGNGFFVVQDTSGVNHFTRDGAFNLNSSNTLVDSSGNSVLGYGVNSNFQVNNATLGPLIIPPPALQTIAQATSSAVLKGSLNASGAVATTGTVLASQAISGTGGATITPTTNLDSLVDFGTSTPVFQDGQVISLTVQQGGRTLPTGTLTVTNTTQVSDLQNLIQNTAAIDPNVPTGTPGPTPGVSLATISGGASGQQLVLTGNVGTNNAITIPTGGFTVTGGTSPLTLSAPSTGASNADGESTHLAFTAYDSLGNPITVDVNATLTAQSNAGTTWNYNVSSPDNQGGNPVIKTGTLTFNTSGQLSSVDGVSNATTGTVTIDRTGTGAVASQQISLDFSGIQALAGTNSNVVAESQNGYANGSLTGYSVGNDGTISGSYSNGLTETIGQVALANFTNPSGLVNQGNNLFTTGANSGNPTITAPQTQGAGSIQSGQLEMSNVDLSKEFINLIIASTGYSASSRVISTSSQLLTELLNSTR